MARRESPTMQEAAASYMEMREIHCATSTVTNDRCLINRFVRDIGPNRRVHTTTFEIVEGWFAIEAKRQQASSYNKVRTRLKNFFDFCARRKMIDFDPLAEIRPRPVVKKDRYRLSPAELLDLPKFAACSRDRALIVLACNTALRGNEISALKISDVDLDNGWLHVTISKSAKEDQMPITKELDTALRQWLVEYQYDQNGHPLQADWYLFPRRSYGYMSADKTEAFFTLQPTRKIQKPFELVQKAMRSAGHVVQPQEGVHTIRRSVARAFFDQNVRNSYDAALRMTSSLLHHSSSQVTEIYLGITTEKLDRDDSLRGKSFLGAMVDSSEVVELKVS